MVVVIGMSYPFGVHFEGRAVAGECLDSHSFKPFRGLSLREFIILHDWTFLFVRLEISGYFWFENIIHSSFLNTDINEQFLRYS